MLALTRPLESLVLRPPPPSECTYVIYKGAHKELDIVFFFGRIHFSVSFMYNKLCTIIMSRIEKDVGKTCLSLHHERRKLSITERNNKPQIHTFPRRDIVTKEPIVRRIASKHVNNTTCGIVSYPSVAARTMMTRITARMTSRQQALFRAFFW